MTITGTVVSQQWYYPYGEVRASTGASPTTLGFTGQRRDAGVGSLMFYQARYYSPALSRFVSADSIVPEAGNPQAFNRYSYGLSNPTKYADPSGHCPVCALLILLALAACGQAPTAPPPTPGPVPEAAVRTERVTLDPQAGTRTIERGGGTLIEENRILTHSHNDPNLGTINDDALTVTGVSGNGVIVPLSANSVDRIDDGTTVVTLPGNAYPGVRPAELASPAEIGKIAAGDFVTLVYWDDAAGKNVTGAFKVLEIVNGVMTLDDPGLIINPGDSGGGAYHNGKFVGNIWSIYTDDKGNRIGKVDVALLPPGVQSCSDSMPGPVSYGDMESVSQNLEKSRLRCVPAIAGVLHPAANPSWDYRCAATEYVFD